MNLEQVSIQIRPRSPWEAVDLGLLMARRWWWPLTKAWLLVTLPLFLLLSFLPRDWLWISYFAVWWLKPLFERPLLYLLSHAVFGHLPDTRSALRAFPGLAWRQWFVSLTWRRFSPYRSMDLPVLQLEGLDGFRRQDRLSLLHREGSSPALWLTIIGVHLEGFITLGGVALLYALLPSEIYIDWMSLLTGTDAAWFDYLANTCTYLAMTLVTPFYVACGFSLYLNRRIKLEAWDIDIAFQRIANKRRPQASLVSVLALLFGLGLLQAAPAEAQVSEPLASEQALTDAAPYSKETAKTQINQVVRGEDFELKETRRRLSFINSDDEEEAPEPEEDDRVFEWIYDLFELLGKLSSLASLFEVLLWGSVAALILLLLVKYRHWLASYLPKRLTLPEVRRPLTLFGMDVTRESLPEDVGATALNLWQSGDHRAALALLYRASLSRLLEAGMEIEDGHTEEECLKLAQGYSQRQPRAQGAITYFGQLTRVWQELAYGHRLPDSEKAQTLCTGWNQAWRLEPEASHG